MTTISHLDRLLDHLEWANVRTLAAVRDVASHEARRLLAHVLAAERVWLRRLETGDSSELEIWPELSLEECEEIQSENLEGYRSFLRSLDADDLDRETTYRNSEGRAFHTPVGEILLHVLLHGTYHRGQIAMRLREAGDVPMNTDLITFVRERPRRAE